MSFFFLLRLIRDFKTKQAWLSMLCARHVTQPTILLILTQILAFCSVTIVLVQLFWFNWLLLQDISAPKLVEISFEFPKLQVPHWPFVHCQKFWLIETMCQRWFSLYICTTALCHILILVSKWSKSARLVQPIGDVKQACGSDWWRWRFGFFNQSVLNFSICCLAGKKCLAII